MDDRAMKAHLRYGLMIPEQLPDILCSCGKQKLSRAHVSSCSRVRSVSRYTCTTGVGISLHAWQWPVECGAGATRLGDAVGRILGRT